MYSSYDIVVYLPKQELSSQQRQPLLGKDFVNIAVVKQQFCKLAKTPELSNMPMQQWRNCLKVCFLCGLIYTVS
jgi:hypothetical protein